MFLKCGVGEDSWESLGLQGDPTSLISNWFGTEIQLRYEYWLEWLMLKLKLQYFGHLMRRTDHWKRPWCWERLKAGGEGDDRGWNGWMASRLYGHEFEQSPRLGDGQGSLACCSPWDCKELDMIEWLNWTKKIKKSLLPQCTERLFLFQVDQENLAYVYNLHGKLHIWLI